MLTSIRTTSDLQERRQIYCVFVLCTLFGAGFGVYFAATANHSYILLMRMAVSRPVSIVGSFAAVFVPYFASFLVVSNSKPWLVYFFCAMRIFFFTSASWAVASAFGSSGWLIRNMLLFPDIFLLPMLIWFSVSRLSRNKSRRCCVLCLAYTALIGIINYCVVSPFLAKVLFTYETMGRYAIHVGLDRRL